jgi:hypothetical protein
MHQPLYSISAGELGETAAEVEDSLELVLELTSKWNAILLLDECDMFLESRTNADIRRNRLISSKFLSCKMLLPNQGLPKYLVQSSSRSSNITEA